MQRAVHLTLLCCPSIASLSYRLKFKLSLAKFKNDSNGRISDMNWILHHSQSEHYVNLAESALREQNNARTIELYRLAAEAEILALEVVEPTQTRTIAWNSRRLSSKLFNDYLGSITSISKHQIKSFTLKV